METFKELGQLKFTKELWLFIVPGTLMLIDFLTGLINAWIKNEIKSSKMREGLGKKCGETVVLIIGQMFTVAISLPAYFLIGLSGYIILMELISICENLDKLGVPIPNWIKKSLKSYRDKIQNDSYNRRKEDKDGN